MVRLTQARVDVLEQQLDPEVSVTQVVLEVLDGGSTVRRELKARTISPWVTDTLLGPVWPVQPIAMLSPDALTLADYGELGGVWSYELLVAQDDLVLGDSGEREQAGGVQYIEAQDDLVLDDYPRGTGQG